MKRSVPYDGETYKVKSDAIDIPDFTQMERMAVLMWLNRNTFARGNGIRSRSNPLQGLGGIVRVVGK